MRFHVQNSANKGAIDPLGFSDSIGDSFGLEVSFGGTAAMVSLDRDDVIDVPGVIGPDGGLKASLLINDESIEFEVDGARDDDEARIRIVSADFIRVQIIHAAAGGPCRARCYDGTEGQPCVDCERDGRTVRICC
jgi:hypothetical protein